MAELDHFTYGLLNPMAAYVMSVLGCLLGLICTVRARRERDGGLHARWLVWAALAIGGTGIWLMHFLAMLGFGVVGSEVRYDPLVTLLSAVAAVGVVGIGLFIVGYGRPRLVRLLGGGLFTGVGVATMHYIGMAAVRVKGDVDYDRGLVALSVLIAVVAATVALWFTMVVQSRGAITAAALIMGVAVCGMHYTGMAAMRVHLHEEVELTGMEPIGFLMPLVLFVSLGLFLTLYAVMTTPSDPRPPGPVRQKALTRS